MHKLVLKSPQKRLSKKVLRKAFVHLEPLGLYYRGRKTFWTKQVGLLALYLQDKETDHRVIKHIHKFLQAIGALERELPNKVVGAFTCQTLGMSLHHPCQNKQCPFWGDYVSRLNCIHHYLADQNRDNLTVAEMGIMSGFSRVHINNLLNDGMKTIRSRALKDLKDESFEQKIEPVKLEGVCAVCGKETNNKSGLFRSEYDVSTTFVYCGLDCYRAKPPVSLFLEGALGVPAVEVIASLPKRYADVTDAATCLTVNEEALKHLLWTKAPDHPFLVNERRHQIEIRSNGRKAWERETHRLIEKITPLEHPQDIVLFPGAVV